MSVNFGNTHCLNKHFCFLILKALKPKQLAERRTPSPVRLLMELLEASICIRRESIIFDHFLQYWLLLCFYGGEPHIFSSVIGCSDWLLWPLGSFLCWWYDWTINVVVDMWFFFCRWNALGLVVKLFAAVGVTKNKLEKNNNLSCIVFLLGKCEDLMGKTFVLFLF